VASDLVPVGRVGRPHGLDGSFFVEGPSERVEVFAPGAVLFAAGEPLKVVASKRGSQNRPVIRLERRVDRGTELAVPRESLPELPADEYYSFELVGLAVEEEGGRLVGRVAWSTLRTTSSSSIRACLCHSWRPACGRWTSLAGES
jgi:16S rRNA processing protein RimM